MSKIWVKGRASAKDGDRERFEEWARELVEKVGTDGPGTLAFGVYPTGEQDGYIFLELYRDSQGALDHLANVGDLLGRMADVADMSSEPLEVYGDLNAELEQAYAGFNASVKPPLYSY